MHGAGRFVCVFYDGTKSLRERENKNHLDGQSEFCMKISWGIHEMISSPSTPNNFVLLLASASYLGSDGMAFSISLLAALGTHMAPQNRVLYTNTCLDTNNNCSYMSCTVRNYSDLFIWREMFCLSLGRTTTPHDLRTAVTPD